MAGRFKYEKLSFYRHMGPQDAALWNRFIETFPNEYEQIDYDVWVGEGAIPADEAVGNVFKTNQKELTKKRIDVVAYRENGEIDCIELRPRAGSTAIGSVLTNHFLLQKEGVPSPCTPLIITDKAQPDLFGIAAKHGIKIIELGF